MTRDLEVLVRDREFRPRAGVEVELHLRGRAVQWNVTRADGLARFAVPDIAPVAVIVDDVVSIYPARDAAGPTRRIAIAQ